MLNLQSKWLYIWVNWKWVLIAILIFAGFITFILPWQAEQSENARRVRG